MGEQFLLCHRGKFEGRTPEILAVLNEKMLGQGQHIAPTVAQGRRTKLHHVKSVIQVLPKIVVLNCLYNIPVGRGNDADVDPFLFIATHTRE